MAALLSDWSAERLQLTATERSTAYILAKEIPIADSGNVSALHAGIT